MKTVFPRKEFDLRGLLEASAEFFVRLGGDANLTPLYIGTIQQREERYEEDPDEFRNADEFPPHAAHFKALERLFSEGETLVLPFAGCNVGEPVECADGSAYSFDPDEGYSGEFTSAVLLVTYAADREEILIVSGLEEESVLMTNVSFREQSIGALDEAAEAFVDVVAFDGSIFYDVRGYAPGRWRSREVPRSTCLSATYHASQSISTWST